MDPHVSLGVVAHILGHPGQPRALELWSCGALDLWLVIAGHTKWQAMKIGASGANCFMNLLLSSPLSLLSWPDCRWGLAAIIVSLE